MANTIETLLCISPDLDYFGRSNGPVAVYCAATLAVLGKSERAVARRVDGSLELRFAGVALIATKCAAPSRWWRLEAVEVAS